MSKKKFSIQNKAVVKSKPDVIKPLKTEVKTDFSVRNISKKQITSFFFLIIGIIIYLLIWKDPEIIVKDPWYVAAIKLDSANKIIDSNAKNKMLNEAGNELKVLIAKYPLHARVHFFLGLYYYNTGEWDSSIVHNKICLHLDSGSTINSIWPSALQNITACYLNKTNTFLRKNDYVSAMKVLHEGLYINPEEPFFYGTLGNLMLHNSNADSALYYYKKSIGLNPKSADVLNNIGVIFQRIGKIDSAAKYFQKALSVDPNHTDAAKNLHFVQNLIKK